MMDDKRDKYMVTTVLTDGQGNSTTTSKEVEPSEKPIDVPSIMYGSGYDKGREDERAEVLAKLTSACNKVKDALAQLESQISTLRKP